MKRPPRTWALTDRVLTLGSRTLIMGVVNVTPDSFFDGGRHFEFQKAMAQAWKLIEEGADIIDVGGESTRPFSEGVSPQEEMARSIPVIEVLAKKTSIPLSIDTIKAEVAQAALEAGAMIINDISGLKADPKMIPLAARSGCGVVLMHMRGRPKNMPLLSDYGDLMAEIKAELKAALRAAVDGGVRREALVIDPGIGFAKKPEHNLEIIGRLNEFFELDRPLLIGPSRKSFIGLALKAAQLADEPDDRLAGSIAAAALAAFKGAHVVRVHDAAAAKQALSVADAIREGAFYE